MYQAWQTDRDRQLPTKGHAGCKQSHHIEMFPKAPSCPPFALVGRNPYAARPCPSLSTGGIPDLLRVQKHLER